MSKNLHRFNLVISSSKAISIWVSGCKQHKLLWLKKIVGKAKNQLRKLSVIKISQAARTKVRINSEQRSVSLITYFCEVSEEIVTTIYTLPVEA